MNKLLKKWFPDPAGELEVIVAVVIFILVISFVVPLVRSVWDDFGRGYGGNPQKSYEDY